MGIWCLRWSRISWKWWNQRSWRKNIGDVDKNKIIKDGLFNFGFSMPKDQRKIGARQKPTEKQWIRWESAIERKLWEWGVRMSYLFALFSKNLWYLVEEIDPASANWFSSRHRGGVEAHFPKQRILWIGIIVYF